MSVILGGLGLLRQSCAIRQLTCALRTASLNGTASLPVVKEKPAAFLDEKSDQIVQKINTQLQAKAEGRLFAVVHLCGKQFKVTAGDIILVEGYWPPTSGDKIRFDKVLLAGGLDFTLIGRPILEKGLVDVQATVIEKTLTHTKTHFRKKRRKQYMRINFYRSPNTMIRINSIDISGKICNDPKDDKKPDKLKIF